MDQTTLFIIERDNFNSYKFFISGVLTRYCSNQFDSEDTSDFELEGLTYLINSIYSILQKHRLPLFPDRFFIEATGDSSEHLNFPDRDSVVSSIVDTIFPCGIPTDFVDLLLGDNISKNTICRLISTELDLKARRYAEMELSCLKVLMLYTKNDDSYLLDTIHENNNPLIFADYTTSQLSNFDFPNINMCIEYDVTLKDMRDLKKELSSQGFKYCTFVLENAYLQLPISKLHKLATKSK